MLLSVTLAILTITAHTAAIIQVLSMTKELAETRHEAAEGGSFMFNSIISCIII